MTRKNRKRRTVDRAERVKPTPEAAQHHRPWPLMLLLHQGPDANGLDVDEFEAGIEIVETFKALTHGLGIAALSIEFEKVAANYSDPMSDRAALMIGVWFRWCHEIGPVATQLVEQIEDASPIRSVEVLRFGLRRWAKLKHDVLRGIDNHPHILTGSAWRDLPAGDRGAHAVPISHSQTPLRQVPSRAGAPAQAALRSATSKR